MSRTSGKRAPSYRDVLDRLDEAFPGRELLTRGEVAAWLGVHRNTVAKNYAWPKGKVSKAQVARSLSADEEERPA